MWRAEHISQDCPRRTSQQTTMPLIERPMCGLLVEAATHGTEIKETAHARSGTTDNMTPGMDATPSPTSSRTMVSIFLQKLRRFQRLSRIGRQPLRRKKQTHKWNDMTVLTNKLKDPYRPASFIGEKVPSMDGLAGGSVMTVQGNHAKTRTTAQDDFPPLSEKLSRTSLRPKASQLRKKKRLYSTRKIPRLDNAVAAAVR